MSRIGVVRSLVAAVLFGATVPAASELAIDVPAFTLAGLLYLGAAVAMVPAVLVTPPTRRALRAEWRPALVAVVAGGAVGPVLLMAGLARTSAASASILLNTELAATVVLAAVLFREQIGRHVAIGSAAVVVAGSLLVWEPGASLDTGALLVVAACVAWGVDNGITAIIDQLTPQQVVMAKGVVAGSANLLIGLLTSGVGASTGVGDVVAALAIGAVGYGLSITLWVQGARDLGAARAQVLFSTAPFVGAAIAWSVLGEPATGRQLGAAVLAAAGLVLASRSTHRHAHVHVVRVHTHDHRHDDGHHDGHHDEDRAHEPPPTVSTGTRHSHPHRHDRVLHTHVHVPDLHHRHGHTPSPGDATGTS